MSKRDSYPTGFDEDVQQNEHNTCPECGGRVTANTHETVCDDCGLVIDEDRIDHGPEWRAVDADERERTGAPRTVTLHDQGLSTAIGAAVDANGSTLPSRRRRRLARQRRLHNRARFRSKRERNRAHGLTEVRRLTSALAITGRLRDQACALFGQAQDADLLPGRSIEAMASACVYAVCRCQGQPLTIDDIARVSRVSRRQVANAYAVLNVDLGLPTPPRPARTFVPRLASELELGRAVERRATELATRTAETALGNGYNPAGVAAACLELACTETGAWVTQEALADAAGVSAVTVRSSRDTLIDALNLAVGA